MCVICSSTGKFLAQLEQELKRLQRRKIFMSEDSTSQAQSLNGGSSSGSSQKEQPLFTLKQVPSVIDLEGAFWLPLFDEISI